MKAIALLCIFLLFSPCHAVANYPENTGEYINDFDNVLPADVEAELSSRLHDIEYYSGVEIVVVTISDKERYGGSSATWESFATGLFNAWGIGNLPENNGVMLLISSGDRKIRIELGAGYPARYDSIMKNIIEEVISPNLKEGDYETAVVLGVEEIIDTVTVPVSSLYWYRWHILAGVGALLSTLIALYAQKHQKKGFFWVFLSLAGFIVLGLLGDLKNGRRGDGFGGGSSGGGGASGDF